MRFIHMVHRYLLTLCLLIVPVFAYAGESDLSDEYPFNVETISMDADDTFDFKISASGEFTVDCGDGGTLSGTGVSGNNTITKGDTTDTTYTCTYSNAGAHTIQFGGLATGYNTNNIIAAISFYVDSSQTKIAGIYGSLGTIFPTLTTSTTSQKQPRFYQTFYMASNMTGEIPENLFAGISGAPASNMFYNTFYGCSGLTGSIPSGLFGNISGTPASSMFNSTFGNCSGLTGTIPTGLFGNISGAPAGSMFNGTFKGCSGLTGSIPSGLFAGISGAPASGMFTYTFYGCSGLTGSIPSGLFGNLSGAPAGSMFNGTFKGCSGLTGSIPSGLFAGISGAPASGMFTYTFYGCSGLTGSIPENLFGNLSGRPASSMFWGTFYGCSGLSGSIPTGLFGNISGAPAVHMFYSTFSGCSGLSGTIPTGLFGNLTGAPASNMFSYTFYGCSKLGLDENGNRIPNSYIPYEMFKNITGVGDGTVNGFDRIFSGENNLDTTCPTDRVNVTKPSTTWGSAAFCKLCGDAEYINNDQCMSCPENASCDGVDATCPEGYDVDRDQNTCVSSIITYTIVYNSNADDASGTMENTQCTYGQPCLLRQNTFIHAKSGYMFGGWKTDANGNDIDYADNATVTNLTDQNDATITLYAHWTPVQCFDDQGQEWTDNGCACKSEYNQDTCDENNGYISYGTCTLGEDTKHKCGPTVCESDFQSTTCSDGWQSIETCNSGGQTYVKCQECNNTGKEYADAWESNTCVITRCKDGYNITGTDINTSCVLDCGANAHWDDTINACACDEDFDQDTCDENNGYISYGTCTLGEDTKHKCITLDTCDPDNIDEYTTSCANGTRATIDTCWSNGTRLTKCETCSNADNVAIWVDGECQIGTCQSGYHQDNNVCVSDYDICETDDGLTGIKTWNPTANDGNGGWGDCNPDTCRAGQYKDANDQCQDCTNAGKEHAEAWTPNTCVITQCQTGYKKLGSGDNTSCISTTCTDEYTVWNDAENSCVCKPGYHTESGNCVSNEKPCAVSELPQYARAGRREWDFDHNTWGACMATECDYNYTLTDGQCIGVCTDDTTQLCDITNGKGTQVCQDGQWGQCTVTGCAEGWALTDNNTCSRCENDGIGVKHYQQNTCTISECDTGYLLANNQCTACDKSDSTGRLEMNGGQCVLTCEDGYVSW